MRAAAGDRYNTAFTTELQPQELWESSQVNSYVLFDTGQTWVSAAQEGLWLITPVISANLSCRVLACLAVMLVLQSQWPLQQAVSLDRGWQGQVMGHSSNRHLLGIDTLAPASAKGSFQAMSNQARPDWVR